MARSLRKIQTKVKRKRGMSSTALIEDSRDARRLRSGMMRQERLLKKESVRVKTLQPKMTRFRYFRQLADSKRNTGQCSVAEVISHVEKFLSDIEEEIQQLAAARRLGRPKTPQEARLTNWLEQEQAEFTSGYEIPDLFDGETVKHLLSWTGETATCLPQVRLVRITREGKVLSL